MSGSLQTAADKDITHIEYAEISEKLAETGSQSYNSGQEYRD